MVARHVNIVDISGETLYSYPRSRCGRRSMVGRELPKLETWVRFPSPVPSLKLVSRRDHMWVLGVFIVAIGAGKS